MKIYAYSLSYVENNVYYHEVGSVKTVESEESAKKSVFENALRQHPYPLCSNHHVLLHEINSEWIEGVE